MIEIKIIDRNGKGVWHLQYPDPDTGKRRFMTLNTTDKKVAQEVCARHIIEHQTRTAGGVPEYLLIDALRKWKDEHLPTLEKPDGYKPHYKAILPFVGVSLLSEIVSVAEALQKAGEEKGLAQATINQRLSILKKTATLAHKKWRPNWLANPIGQNIELPIPDNGREVILTESEIYKLTEAIKPQLVKEYVMFLAFTGLRKAEMFRVTPQHLNVVAGGVELRVEGKCGRRTIPLETDQAAFVMAHTPLKFTDGYFHTHFREAANSLGWDHVRMHDLRHSYAVWLLENNVDHAVIMELMGHKSVMMLKRYLNLTSSHLRDKMPKRKMNAQPALKAVK